MMTPAMREDLSQRADEFKRFKQADYLRKMGEQGMGLAKSVARGVPQMATGLVDLAAMPFEAAGVLQPGQAVGSTKWLENKGYLPESQEGFLNQTAELLSGGFDPSDLVTKGAPLLMGVGKTVWHGSPHTFDKFDISKIGTGEGAQAYGHGLYLAESPDVAKGYQTNLAKNTFLSPTGTTITKNKLIDMGFDKGQSDIIFNAIKSSGGDFSKASELVNQKSISDFLKSLSGASINEGQLYKVDLPDEQIAKMLDWDKPFSEQPQSVQDAITKYWSENRVYGDPTKLTGEGIYGSVQGHVLGNRGSDIANRSASQEAASMDLNYMGIPGIQYLDQASRGAGEGTRNYVVFSDEIPQILERNGTPLGNAVRNFEPTQTLESLNPTGTVFTGYDPTQRATMPLGKNIGTLDKTMGVNPDEMVTIYRGVPSDVSQISPGDFITTNEQLAKDYAGSGKVISQKVPARTVLDDLTEPLGEEYIYRP